MSRELRAWAYLSRVAEPPCAELSALVARVGAVEAAERVLRGAVCAEAMNITEEHVRRLMRLRLIRTRYFRGDVRVAVP
jgi:hypothetical protein